MKQLGKYGILLTCLLLVGCDCDTTYTCPEVREKYTYLICNEVGDTLEYVNGVGDTLTFAVVHEYKSPAYTRSCGRGEPAGCYCRECEATISFRAKCDTSYASNNGYSISINETNQEGKTTLSSFHQILFLNFRATFNLLDTMKINPTPLFSPVLQLQGKTFYNVYFFSSDTTNASSALLPVWEIYYTKNEGVIAFNERKFHSQFVKN